MGAGPRRRDGPRATVARRSPRSASTSARAGESVRTFAAITSSRSRWPASAGPSPSCRSRRSRRRSSSRASTRVLEGPLQVVGELGGRAAHRRDGRRGRRAAADRGLAERHVRRPVPQHARPVARRRSAGRRPCRRPLGSAGEHDRRASSVIAMSRRPRSRSSRDDVGEQPVDVRARLEPLAERRPARRRARPTGRTSAGSRRAADRRAAARTRPRRHRRRPTATRPRRRHGAAADTDDDEGVDARDHRRQGQPDERPVDRRPQVVQPAGEDGEADRERQRQRTHREDPPRVMVGERHWRGHDGQRPPRQRTV